MISAKIDVTKLDKSAFFKGTKGVYCDITIIEKPSEYGDGFIVQDLGKERRMAGEKGPIIGNWKEVGTKAPTPSPARQESSVIVSMEDHSDIPF
jgi:hypothetical protein